MHDQIINNGIEIQRIRIRESVVLLVLRILLLQLLLGVFLYGITVINLMLTLEDIMDRPFPVITLLYISSVIFFLIYTIIAILQWRNHHYVIQRNGITHRTGLFSYQEQNYSCSNIESISLNQGVWGKLFNFGTIELYDPALERHFFLHYVSQPQHNLELLKRMFLKAPPGRNSIRPTQSVIIREENA